MYSVTVQTVDNADVHHLPSRPVNVILHYEIQQPSNIDCSWKEFSNQAHSLRWGKEQINKRAWYAKHTLGWPLPKGASNTDCETGQTKAGLARQKTSQVGQAAK